MHRKHLQLKHLHIWIHFNFRYVFQVFHQSLLWISSMGRIWACGSFCIYSKHAGLILVPFFRWEISTFKNIFNKITNFVSQLKLFFFKSNSEKVISQKRLKSWLATRCKSSLLFTIYNFRCCSARKLTSIVTTGKFTNVTSLPIFPTMNGIQNQFKIHKYFDWILGTYQNLNYIDCVAGYVSYSIILYDTSA